MKGWVDGEYGKDAGGVCGIPRECAHEGGTPWNLGATEVRNEIKRRLWEGDWGAGSGRCIQ